MYEIRIQQAKKSIFASNISLEMAIKTISNLFESYIMEENRIQNITKYSLFQLCFWRKHLPNQTRWIARTVMVEENDIDKGKTFTEN